MELYCSLEYSEYISQCVSVYTGYVVTIHEGNTCMNMGQYYS